MLEGNRALVETNLTGRDKGLHPAWQEFIRYCRELRHGEIERLSIQDGVPVLAEQVKKKVRFTR